jgi:hypothetical protein
MIFLQQMQGLRSLAGRLMPRLPSPSGLGGLLSRVVGMGNEGLAACQVSPYTSNTDCTTPMSGMTDWLLSILWPHCILVLALLQQQQVRGMANHRHKKIIKMAKGYRGRTNCFRIAVQRVEKALLYAYRDRKVRLHDEVSSLWLSCTFTYTRRMACCG